jgi:hypothetical protein
LTKTLSRFANAAQNERNHFVRVDNSVLITIPDRGFTREGGDRYAVNGALASCKGAGGKNILFYQRPPP